MSDAQTGPAVAASGAGDGDAPDVVLAVYTHPDDCEISCGATLAKWAEQGKRIIVAVVTDGRRGSQDPDEDVGELVRIRREEARAGAKVLGATDVRFLDYRDGELENTPEVRADIARLIREVRPKILMTADPSIWFFHDPNDSSQGAYFNHRDHRKTGEAVLDAAAPGAGNPHFFSEQLAEGLTPWDVPEAWLAPTTEANHTEDVSGFVQTKIAALREHRSQLTDDQLAMFEDWIPSWARVQGKEIGVEAGEGFRVLRLG
jgi:LmbE family N-acetylglucosaminyl deacetylase